MAINKKKASSKKKKKASTPKKKTGAQKKKPPKTNQKASAKGSRKPAGRKASTAKTKTKGRTKSSPRNKGNAHAVKKPRRKNAQFEDINSPLTLPCGAVLANRLAKAAMTERLCLGRHQPNQKHIDLYQSFLYGPGRKPRPDARLPGLLLTGNIMVDRKSFESAGNVCIEDEYDAEAARTWVQSVVDAPGADRPHLWAQIGHPGRQTSIIVNARPISPSDVKLKKGGLFAKPRPLSDEGIWQLIQRFVRTAELCKSAGFTGVQFHSAHGYLGSQFLSPITNLRSDEWGGSLENRFRFLREIIVRARKQLGADFPISVKLNSADFQKGGFSEEESMQVVKWLDDLGVDLIEISGGSYENPSFLQSHRITTDNGQPVRESTAAREAFFIEYAEQVRKQVKRAALMVTGGFRNRYFCDEVIASGAVDVIGAARPFLTENSFADDFLSNTNYTAQKIDVQTSSKLLGLFATGGFWNIQVQRLARGKKSKLSYSPIRAAAHILNYETIYAAVHRVKPK